MGDVELALRWFGQLSRIGVRRVWLRPDLYERIDRLFERPVPEGFVATVCGVQVYCKAERER